MKIGKTNRGFDIIKFNEDNGEECSIQISSSALDDMIWFGISKPQPKILASKVMENGTGWVDYCVPENVFINSRMHLSRESVKRIIPILQRFVDTGEIIEHEADDGENEQE